MPLIESEYRAPWWLTQPHAQTVWPSLFRKPPHIALTKERVELEDGDFIDLYWSGPENAPTILILHGLEGSIDSSYTRGTMAALNGHGLRACLMHFRGCGNIPNRLPIAYHSGKTDDPASIAEHIQATTGHYPFGAIGFSLGGNVLLKWLGEMGERSILQRAAVMSVPFKLNDAALRLHKGLSRIYERHLVGSLQKSYLTKFKSQVSPLQVDVSQLNTFHRFDDQVTAPLHGFQNVDHYYQVASSRQYIPAIRTPTLILHALDDPFMFPHTPPTAEELPEQVSLELTKHGGHVGFIQGRWPWQAEYWGEQRLANWIASDSKGIKKGN